MKIVLVLGIILGAVAGMLGAVCVGGLFLARSHSATRSMKLGVAPEVVWDLITDHAGQASWRPGLRSVERAPDVGGRAGWREIDTSGQEMSIEIVESVPASRLVTRIIDDGLPFGGTWTWQIAPEPGGCRVRITEDGFIKPPPFRYIARLIGHDATMNKYLGALAAKLGQSAAVEP